MYNFELNVPDEYPHKPPDVKLAEKVGGVVVICESVARAVSVCNDFFRRSTTQTSTIMGTCV